MFTGIFLAIAYFLVGLLIALMKDRHSAFGIHWGYAWSTILLWPISILEMLYDGLKGANKGST